MNLQRRATYLALLVVFFSCVTAATANGSPLHDAPLILAESNSVLEGAIRGGLIGAAVGAVVGAIVYVVKKKDKGKGQ
jgi:hypothetical protein